MHRPDAIHVQETFLKVEHKLSIPGYKVIRKDRATRGGGLATFLKQHIKVSDISDDFCDAFETLSVIIQMENASTLKLVNIYVPRNSGTFKRKFKSLLVDQKTIVAGDLNAKHFEWDSGINNLGRKLHEILPYNGFLVSAPDEPTYYAPDGSMASNIDLFVTNIYPPPLAAVVPDYLSDHAPVKCVINQRYIRAEPRKIFAYKDANWTEYRNAIRDSFENWNIQPDAGIEELDDAFDWLSEAIIRAREIAVPQKAVSGNRETPRSVATINALHLKKLLNQKLKLRGLPEDEIAATKRELREAARMVAKNADADRFQNWSKFIAQANESTEKFWKTTKMARNLRSRPPTSMCDEDGLEATDNESMCEMLADFFAASHEESQVAPSAFDRRCKGEANDIRSDPEAHPFTPITVELIESGFRRLKNAKAPGIDGITAVLLKRLPQAATTQLATLFNRCLTIGHWPAAFKTALIVAIPKKGKDSRAPNGYRPISLLPIVGKVFERILADRLSAHCEIRNIFPKFQFGFRGGHAADLQAAKMGATLQHNKNRGKNSAVLAFDISNAFPSVWPDGLSHKMAKLGFPKYLTRIIASFLVDRNMVVRAFGRRSTPRSLESGVPQGSCLSPVLYNIFTSDTPTARGIDVFQFADDTAAVAASPQKEAPVRKLQKYAAKLSRYCRRWHLKLCSPKTQFVYFPKKWHVNRMPMSQPEVDGVMVERKPTMSYLGVTYDAKLTFRTHIEGLKSKVNAKLHTLLSVVLGPALNRRFRLRLIRCVLWPTLMYAAATWGLAPNRAKTELRRKFSSAAKTILRLPRCTSTVYLMRLLKLPLLEEAALQARGILIERLQRAAEPMEDLIDAILILTPD